MAPRPRMSSKSSCPSVDPAVARLSNLLGAWALAISDRVVEAAEASAGRGSQAPAALVALHQFAAGSTIEELRGVLGLSHPAAVRLIDGLVGDGHVVREQAANDRRAVAVCLTASGRSTAERIMAARQQAIEATLAGLTELELRALTALAERLTADVADLRLSERRDGAPPPGGWLCRLCDFQACGRHEGRCPAATSAAASSLLASAATVWRFGPWLVWVDVVHGSYQPPRVAKIRRQLTPASVRRGNDSGAGSREPLRLRRRVLARGRGGAVSGRSGHGPSGEQLGGGARAACRV